MSRSAGWTKADNGVRNSCDAMSQKRLLALLSLLLGLVAGLLLLLKLLNWPNSVTLKWVADVAVLAILGFVVIVAAIATYKGQYMFGGIINIVIGLAVLIYWRDTIPGLFALLGGILAVIAEES